MRRFLIWSALLTAVLFGQPTTGGQDKKQTEATEKQSSGPAAEIVASVKAYVQAYNKGDAKAVAALWSDDGEYIGPDGERVKGKKAIQEAFQTYFAANKGIQLQVAVDSVRLIKSDVAMEEGTAVVTFPGGDSEESTYLAVHVKHNGKWVLDSVRETATPAPDSNYAYLKSLEWLVGDWVDADDNVSVLTSCRWGANRNFLISAFTVIADNKVIMQGTQIIGWDPAAGNVRSWVFDSNGGFGQGEWTRKSDKWLIKTNSVQPDGKKASSTNILTYVDDNQFTWESINRILDGAPQPSLDAVTVERKKSAE